MMDGESYIIGIDIGGTKTSVSLWTSTKELIQKYQFSTKGSPESVIGRITAETKRILEETPAKPSEVAAVGIICCGPLDIENGLVLSPPNLPGWDKVPLVALLEDHLEIPCFLENDANACVLAEWRWGAGRDFQNVVFLTFDTGMGAGLILNGQLYQGAFGLAGEVGHMRIAEDSPETYGKRGSWEGFCSGGGLTRRYADLTGKTESGKYICKAAEDGDEEALQVVEVCAFYLGRGVAQLIDILNPECIIIGSIFVRNEKLFRPIMEKEIKQEALSESWKRCKIVPAQLGEILGDKAALGVALDNLEKSGR
ncbi:MAG: ROK family protein [Treponema sp.]|jgi:glucokinase|nr:ROK family protein [Treponema sp.]